MADAQVIVRFVVNGTPVALALGRDLGVTDTLAHVLRDTLGLMSVKIGCNQGACGACTILLNGKAVLSCAMLALEADGHSLQTLEGLPPADPMVRAFAEQCEPGYGTAMQCGFCTPGFIMAGKALLGENPAPTAGEVKEALSGHICRCGCYEGITQAVLHAAEADGCVHARPPKKPLVPRKARAHVGHYRPRLDGLEKASGRAVFAGDFATKGRFPDLLHARVLRSPFPHALIKNVDTARAEELPGVTAVLTYKDEEVQRLKPLNAGWTDGVNTVSYDGMLWKFRDREVLSDYVCWVGDEAGVVIAAETEEIADEALRLLDVEWEVLPFVLDPVEAMKPGAPRVHESIAGGNVLPPDPTGGPDVFLDVGDVEAAFAESDVMVEARASHHRANQGCLENWTCLAKWDGDRVTIWSNSYEANQTRMFVSQMLGLPENKVRVISNYVGGQFGRGDTGEQPFFIFVALLAKKAGRPVFFSHDRREAFHDSRQAIIYDGKAAATKDGVITALAFRGLGNIGAYSDQSMFALKYAPLVPARSAFAHIPNVRMEAYGVYTNSLPGCMMRGVGNSQLNLILGLLVDVLAERLGVDPIELVLKNFGHEWESLPNKSLKAVLTEGAKRIGWEERHRPGAGSVYEDSKKRGIGFSFHPQWHAAWQEQRRGEIQVGICLNPDGSVMLDAPTVECGPGSSTCNLLGCAEALSFLRVSADDIHWLSVVDTDTSLPDVVQTDSSVSYLQSEAMVSAARELRNKILQAAAPRLGAAAEDLDVADGRVYRRESPAEWVHYKDVLWPDHLIPVSVIVSEPPNSEETGVPFFAHFAEVEVDTATGKVEVLKLVLATDCGTVMFPAGAEGQQLGGQCQGVGEALTEEIIYDERTGVPLNFNWIDYQIPTAVDLPEIEALLFEVWQGAGEYGASGLGEGTLTPTPRAIANAVYNAIGVRIDDIPIKPEKVLRALGSLPGESGRAVR